MTLFSFKVEVLSLFQSPVLSYSTYVQKSCTPVHIAAFRRCPPTTHTSGPQATWTWHRVSVVFWHVSAKLTFRIIYFMASVHCLLLKVIIKNTTLYFRTGLVSILRLKMQLKSIQLGPIGEAILTLWVLVLVFPVLTTFLAWKWKTKELWFIVDN